MLKGIGKFTAKKLAAKSLKSSVDDVTVSSTGKPHQPGYLPDEALVVRGGENLPKIWIKGSGVELDEAGKIIDASVSSRAGATLEELTGTV